MKTSFEKHESDSQMERLRKICLVPTSSMLKDVLKQGFNTNIERQKKK
jgi:hypothetical protein